MIGTGIATLIAGLAGAGASAFGAQKASSAAKKSSETEGQSAKEALDFAKEQAEKRRQALDPFAQFGGSALSGLAALMGLPAPKSGASIPPSNAPTAPTSAPTPPSESGMGAMGSAAERAAAMANAARGNPISNPGAGTSGMPTDVELMAPDGSRRRVPASQVPFWMSKGAKRVM